MKLCYCLCRLIASLVRVCVGCRYSAMNLFCVVSMCGCTLVVVVEMQVCACSCVKEGEREGVLCHF